MNKQNLEQAIVDAPSNPHQVFVVLMRNGMEIVTRIRHREMKISSDPEFTLVKPMLVRVHGIPIQTPQGMAVKTAAQPTPITLVMQAEQIPLYAEDVWHITQCPKAATDMYVQETSGIVLG